MVHIDAFPAGYGYKAFTEQDLVDMIVPIVLCLRVAVKVHTNYAHRILVLGPVHGLPVLRD